MPKNKPFNVSWKTFPKNKRAELRAALKAGCIPTPWATAIADLLRALGQSENQFSTHVMNRRKTKQRRREKQERKELVNRLHKEQARAIKHQLKQEEHHESAGE